MIALFCLFLALFASPFKSKSRLEAENAALRHQLIMGLMSSRQCAFHWISVPFLVRADEPAVAGYIGCDNGHEPSLPLDPRPNRPLVCSK